MSLYSGLYKIFAGFIKRLYRVEIRGAENEPLDIAYIASSNHLSNQDVIIVAASLKRQVRFMAKAELFKIPGLKQLITTLGAFPVKRGEGDVGSIKKTISLLGEGQVVGFYPQGKRYAGIHPRQTKPRNGIGMIACRTKAAILPIAITAKNFKIRPFRKTIVTIGRPIYYDELGVEAYTQSEYARISELVFAKITEMID